MPIPHVDPIPVPAPLWLIKVLLLLTLSLHFIAVEILVGSLAAIIWFSLRGQSGDLAYQTAAAVLSKRVTVVMTFVINLGIPPLLFAQVLYGRVLYTSSILIGAIWFGVIFILMALYSLLYRIQYRSIKGEPVALHAAAALFLAGSVGRILTMNMTLMLRPEVWLSMYNHSARGISVPPFDPTAWPRWGFIMVGGLLTSGLWLILHSGLSTIEDDTKQVLRKSGGLLVIIGGAAQLALGYLVYQTQPLIVQQGLGSTGLYLISAILWAVSVILTVILGGTQISLKKFNPLLTGAAWLTGFLSIVGSVIVRDGIRDLTLSSKGFDVWERTVVANWGVLVIFFILFVATAGIIAWLLLVLGQAKPIQEQVTI